MPRNEAHNALPSRSADLPAAYSNASGYAFKHMKSQQHGLPPARHPSPPAAAQPQYRYRMLTRTFHEKRLGKQNQRARYSPNAKQIRRAAAPGPYAQQMLHFASKRAQQRKIASIIEKL